MSPLAQALLAFYIGTFGSMIIFTGKQGGGFAVILFCIFWFFVCVSWSIWREDSAENKNE